MINIHLDVQIGNADPRRDAMLAAFAQLYEHLAEAGIAFSLNERRSAAAKPKAPTEQPIPTVDDLADVIRTANVNVAPGPEEAFGDDRIRTTPGFTLPPDAKVDPYYVPDMPHD